MDPRQVGQALLTPEQPAQVPQERSLLARALMGGMDYAGRGLATADLYSGGILSSLAGLNPFTSYGKVLEARDKALQGVPNDLKAMATEPINPVAMGMAMLPGKGKGLASYIPSEHYPQTGLNPIHEVHDWPYVRKMVRAARRGDEIPPILYDGQPNNGNLLAGTHRSAANEIMHKTGKGKPIDMVALDEVVADPKAYGLTPEQAQRLRDAALDGDFDTIDSIWDRPR